MLDDSAVVLPAVGHYWFNPTKNVGIPDDVMNPGGAWVDCGHTSLDDPFSLTRDGGDVTTLGTWQKPRLRNSIETFTDSIAFQLQQWSSEQYQMYFGANSVKDGKWTKTPTKPVEVEGSLLVVVEDGDEQLPLYSGHVSIGRADDIEFDAEAFAGMPVRATLLEDFRIGDKSDWLAQALALDAETATLDVAATRQLVATVTRTDTTTADVTASATWTSSDDAVATVVGGLVTAVAAGSATVTATYAGLTAECDVTVSAE